jgi:hypothetical protein
MQYSSQIVVDTMDCLEYAWNIWLHLIVAVRKDLYMSTKIEDRISERIKQVQNKIDDLKHKLALEEKALDTLKALGGDELIPSNIPRAAQEGSLVKHIDDALTASSKEMTIAELSQALATKGITTTAKAGMGAAIASAVTRRKDLFVKVKRGVYNLKNRNKETI